MALLKMPFNVGAALLRGDLSAYMGRRSEIGSHFRHPHESWRSGTSIEVNRIEGTLTLVESDEISALAEMSASDNGTSHQFS